MATVRRCDNQACTTGPAGTPNVAGNANPADWLSISVTPSAGSQPVTMDACSAECALTIAQATITV